jgi:outer membrane lipoprotein SlyB
MSGRLRKTQKRRGGVWGGGAFTFARAAAGPLPAILGLALTLCGCAPTARPSLTAAAPETPAGPTGPAYGTIDAVRPARLSDGLAGGDAEAQILTAMGVAVPAGGAAGSEIVVQTDDGQTLSVVQANPAGLAPGQRVEIVPGAMPRLEPLAGAAPAS